MDIARDICTDSFYIVNSGLPCIPVTAVLHDSVFNKKIWPTMMRSAELYGPVAAEKHLPSAADPLWAAFHRA